MDVLLKPLRVLAAALMLSGCAITDEFNRQGGFTDRILDTVLFAAETREHRVFRSYLLVGILARIGSESPVNLDDREAVGFRIAQAVQASKDALICAKDSHCAFFEDRQAILDRRLFRLAVAVLYPEETRDLLAKVRGALQGKVPVAGRALTAASAAIELVGEAGGAVNEAAGIVNSLLDLGYTGLQYSQRLGPLYRDSLDLDMRILMAALEGRLDEASWKCSEKGVTQVVALPEDDPAFLKPEEATTICVALQSSRRSYNGSVASIGDWRRFLNGEAKHYAGWMKPREEHWIQASDLIWRGCDLLLKRDKVISTCRPPKSLIYESAMKSMWSERSAAKAELD